MIIRAYNTREHLRALRLDFAADSLSSAVILLSSFSRLSRLHLCIGQDDRPFFLPANLTSTLQHLPCLETLALTDLGLPWTKQDSTFFLAQGAPSVRRVEVMGSCHSGFASLFEEDTITPLEHLRLTLDLVTRRSISLAALESSWPTLHSFHLSFLDAVVTKDTLACEGSLPSPHLQGSPPFRFAAAKQRVPDPFGPQAFPTAFSSALHTLTIECLFSTAEVLPALVTWIRSSTHLRRLRLWQVDCWFLRNVVE